MDKLFNARLISILIGLIIIVNFAIIGCQKNKKTTTTTGKDTSGITTLGRTDTGTIKHDTGMTKTGITKLVCILTGTKDNKITGTLTFSQDGKKVKVTGTINGLTPGEHGIHIHEKGDCSTPDFSSAGNHFNPNNGQHGDFDKKESHMGDLGNLKANKDGKAEINEISEYINLNEILGKAVIIHANVDDLKSQPAGNSGPRIACGVIEKAK